MGRTVPVVIGGVIVAAAVAGGIFLYLGGPSGGAFGGGPGDAAIQAWAGTMRAAGYEVAVERTSTSGGGTSLEGVTLANPAEGWRWTAPEVLVSGSLGGEGMRLGVSGAQKLIYNIGGEERTAEFAAEKFEVTLKSSEAHPDGAGALALDVASLRLNRPGGGDTVLARRVQVGLNRAAGAEVVPDGSSATVEFEDMVLPEYRRSAFGDTIQRFYAAVELQRGLHGLDPRVEIPAWQSAPNSFMKLAGSGISWGQLNLQAGGILRLDPLYRPTGKLESRVYNVMSPLDALLAAGMVDVPTHAAFKSTLFDALNTLDPTAATPFPLRIRNGMVDLADEAMNLPLITLGTVGPLFGVKRGQ